MKGLPDAFLCINYFQSSNQNFSKKSPFVMFLHDNIVASLCEICSAMAKHKYKPRKLKIHTRYRTKKYGHTTIPEIRLIGRCLQKLGFEQGQTIKVTPSLYRLVIELEGS
jgi:toxic protein SymE